ncbi:hypothetical protein [Microbulbifer litoralis]|uniref:hypothetical protein n=1 Tax=Microbulbifer litoralis TaxID=2933965 RepID=UPI0020292A8C|nr:hypothetical protein [Microbulbifer sp. GX H0434]
MKMKLLDYTLVTLLTGVAPPLTGEEAAQQILLPGSETSPRFNCTAGSCSSDEGVLVTVTSRGDSQPHTTDAPATEKALQPDRRVTLAMEQPGSAVATGHFSVPLPGGGVIWATEDPALGIPEMAVTSPSVIPFNGNRITQPVRFMVRSNYSAFIQRLEISIYRGGDGDLVDPIATVPVPVAAVTEGYWDGTLPQHIRFHHGDQLVYVLRAYSRENPETYDETFPRTLQLVRRDEATRHSQQIRASAERGLSSALSVEQAQTQSMLETVFSGNGLRLQNIPVYGSRIRIHGRNIPYGQSLFINGFSYPVDMENKFAAEFLMPIGQHTFDIALSDPDSKDGLTHYPLAANVTGKYFFGVAIADITLSENDIDGSEATFEADERYDGDDDFLKEGRLAFYLKGKTRGKYLITAQMDTTERELDELFSDFGQAYPTDIFRRLDPDYYYPTYGDDSVTYRDVDTQGRFYLRADWDKNQALWGNFTTGMTGTDYAQYVRSLYGAAGVWYSRSTNLWGEPLTEMRLFGSEAETAPGHNEFLGTGGSLYYLKHTDILPGSDVVVLEIRDTTTGRVENRVPLDRGVDYEIDELQGRIIMTRALAQITRQNVPSLTRNQPLDGFEQRLIVDYEWVPSDFDDDNITSGGRAKQWLNDHIAVGGTYVDENRSGDDYQMVAGDLTLQAGRGTYLKMEYSSTESFSAPSYFSDNGGFNFALLNRELIDDPYSPTEGDGQLVEGRVNMRELGWTELQWSAGAWWRDTEDGFSVNRYNNDFDTTETGGEILGEICPNVSLYFRHSDLDQGGDSYEQSQGNIRWDIDDYNTVAAEVRRVDEDSHLADANGTLAGLQYTRRFGSALEVWGLGQVSFDETEDYDDNDLVGIGSRWLFGNSSAIGGEITSGGRGDALSVDGDYRVNADYSIYAGYTYSTDTTERRYVFDPHRTTGWTLGQRWRLSNQVNLFNENTYLKDPNQSGLAHTVGLDFYPSRGWNVGVTLQKGDLIDIYNGEVERKAVSLQGGRRSPGTDWQSKVEWRQDDGFEQREQWVTTHRLSHKVSESLRLAGRLNYSDTDDDLDLYGDAKFIEGNVGFAWRPWNSTRWALFGRLTHLYDLATLAQWGGTDYDQKTSIASFEGIYQIAPNWELAAKLARREGEVRFGRGKGTWFDSDTSFAGAQLRYDFGFCHGLAEYRWLDVEDGGTRDGVLVGVDRDIAEHFRMGIGYNFTDFSDDLTDFDYDQQGWYINFVGSY